MIRIFYCLNDNRRCSFNCIDQRIVYTLYKQAIEFCMQFNSNDTLWKDFDFSICHKKLKQENHKIIKNGSIKPCKGIQYLEWWACVCVPFHLIQWSNIVAIITFLQTPLKQYTVPIGRIDFRWLLRCSQRCDIILMLNQFIAQFNVVINVRWNFPNA